MRRPLAIAVVLSGLGLAAFLLLRPAPPESDEDQIRGLFAEVARRAGDRDLSAIMERISPAYRGEGGTRDELRRYLAGYILRSDWVSVVEKVSELSIDGETAQAVVVVLMARGPIPEGPRPDPELTAGSHRIETGLVKEIEGWRVVSARRRAAGAGDWLR